MPTVSLLGCTHIHTPGFCRALASRDGVTVKRLFDDDLDAARRMQGICGGEIADNAEHLVADPGIDAVVICSETIKHRAYVEATLKAGKHLFVEKPLGMDAFEATSMARAIDQAGLIFQTGYFMRGQPEVRTVRKLAREGVLGKLTRLRLSNVHPGAMRDIFSPRFRWMTDPDQAGCGALGDLGTHVLDLLLWIMAGDDVSLVTGALGNAIAKYGKGVDEYGEAMVRFRSGAIATLAGGWVDWANPHFLEVSGSEGHARITDGKLYVTCEALGAQGDSPYRDLEPGLPHAFELFLDALAGEEAELVSPTEAAFRNRVMDGIYAGARGSDWVAPHGG